MRVLPTSLTETLAADDRMATLLVYPDNTRAVRADERHRWTRDAEPGPIHPRSGRPQERCRQALADAGNVAGGR